jgi:hypothetical protein
VHFAGGRVSKGVYNRYLNEKGLSGVGPHHGQGCGHIYGITVENVEYFRPASQELVH